MGDTLPEEYQNCYVTSPDGTKLILPLGTTPMMTNYEVCPIDVLDLGCGKGRVAHDMAMYTGGRAMGLNIDVT